MDDGTVTRKVRSRVRLAVQLLAADRPLLADYIRLYASGRLGGSEHLVHHPVPDAVTWEEGCAAIRRAVGPWEPGSAIELARSSALSGSSSADGVGERLAGDPSLGELIYVLIRALRPDHVIETGVAGGLSSAFALAALEDNGKGTLTSIDLPVAALVVAGAVGSRVPPTLRHRWRYRWGDARRLLPRALAETAGRRVFIHDSDHSYRNMRWELEEAWRSFLPGDWLVADDANLHGAFRDVATAFRTTPYFVSQERKASCTGLMRRT